MGKAPKIYIPILLTLILAGFFYTDIKNFVPINIKEYATRAIMIAESKFSEKNFDSRKSLEKKAYEVCGLEDNKAGSNYVTFDKIKRAISGGTLKTEDLNLMKSNGFSTLALPVGDFYINDSLVVPSGFGLVGSGKKTRIISLKKTNIVRLLPKEFEIRWDLAKGYMELRAETSGASGFSIGETVSIRTSKLGGWNTVYGYVEHVGRDRLIVRSVDSKLELLINQLLQSTLYISNHAPLLELKNVNDVVLANFVVEPLGATFKSESDADFTDAAIFVAYSSNVIINGVSIKNYDGEALSIQSGKNIRVVDSEFVGNKSYGIHFGTGLRNLFVKNNKVYKNGGGGIYFCANVTEALVSNNDIYLNDGDGVSGLGGGGDRDNIVAKNRIFDNNGCGVRISEYRNAIVGNVIDRNKGGSICHGITSFGNIILYNIN